MQQKTRTCGWNVHKNRQGNSKHKPDALVHSEVPISRGLIDIWCRFCRDCEHDSGPETESHSPHMPEFSTTRSFPGVRAVTSASIASSSVLTLLEYEEPTPPIAPSKRGILPVSTVGSTNTKAITESTSISDKEEGFPITSSSTCFILRPIKYQSSRQAS